MGGHGGESRYGNVGNMRMAAPVMPSPYQVAWRYWSLAVIEVAALTERYRILSLRLRRAFVYQGQVPVASKGLVHYDTITSGSSSSILTGHLLQIATVVEFVTNAPKSSPYSDSVMWVRAEYCPVVSTSYRWRGGRTSKRSRY